jgi:hypothetical protein
MACQIPDFTVWSEISCKRRFSVLYLVCVMLCVHVYIQIKPEKKHVNVGQAPHCELLTIPVPEAIGSHGCKFCTTSLRFHELCWGSHKAMLDTDEFTLGAGALYEYYVVCSSNGNSVRETSPVFEFPTVQNLGCKIVRLSC